MRYSEINTGDTLYKNTEFNDKGKPFLMRVVNWATSKIQGVKDKDHVEFFHWDNGILSVTSSVFGPGVRTQSFEHWKRNEGFPKIEILRRSHPFSAAEIKSISISISNDRGLPYGLIKALKAKISHDDENTVSDNLQEDGIFCSEQCSKLSGYNDWKGDWPLELYDKQISSGYSILFNGECSEITA